MGIDTFIEPKTELAGRRLKRNFKTIDRLFRKKNINNSNMHSLHLFYGNYISTYCKDENDLQKILDELEEIIGDVMGSKFLSEYRFVGYY